ncbi:MAG TPA: toll/interleukin-1 receptor domain-containing protein [Pyrinomonadaceae bacterium]|nr:toll/interleukin-1 receptor domain-containing protein [Pyrinomonadaceae bacterium]
MEALSKTPKTRSNLQRRGRKSVKVFISHSHRDASFTKLLCDFLTTSELVKEEIRCTSVPKHGYTLGRDVEEAIRKDIGKAKIVIGFFTKDSLKSSNVLLELGAGWGLGKILIPILGPRVKASDLPEWIQGGHRMAWTHRECWEEFEKIFRDDLGKPLVDKGRFNKMIDKLVKWQPKPPRP